MRLSSSARSAIAIHAANARWGASKRPSSHFMPSVRLENPSLDNPVYLEEMLSEGAWRDWHILYRCVANEPFGDTACALEKVCSSTKIYGATALWLGILRSLQGGAYEATETH